MSNNDSNDSGGGAFYWCLRHNRVETDRAKESQQRATADILRVIAGSRGDVQPVFETIVASAARLCDAAFSALTRYDGERLHLVAVKTMSPEETAAYHSLFPRPAARNGE